MQKVVTAAEMREIDRLTTEKYGIPSLLLMENAAHAAARVITEKLGGSVDGKSFLILCGPGNNGGDGAVLAKILNQHGADVEVFLPAKLSDTRGDARVCFEKLAKLQSGDESNFEGLRFHYIQNGDESDPPIVSSFVVEDVDVIVDAGFGTGLSRPLDERFIFLAGFNTAMWPPSVKRPILFSIDMPSGLNADLCAPIGPHFEADLTVTFTAPKMANVLPPASNFNGELIVADIGSPQNLIDDCESQVFLADRSDVVKWLRQTEFSQNSYKNRRGHALIVAGSKRYAGAAVLCANACERTGVGLVTLATADSAYYSVSPRLLPEIMCMGLPENEDNQISSDAADWVFDLAFKADVLAIGCGLHLRKSTEETLGLVKLGYRKKTGDVTREFIRKVIGKIGKTLLIDADALTALSPFELEGSEVKTFILTPHEGEFLRLLGTEDRRVLKDRVACVRQFAEKHKVILVLKGERTMIGAPDGRVVVNPTGNVGLGKGGNGDTLSGIITGFVAQTIAIDAGFKHKFNSPALADFIFDAVVAAVYVAGLAGDIAERKYGKRVMTASDVRECLVDAFNEIEKSDD